jgi:hypothetical protein
MSTLQPCPCGATPQGLSISDECKGSKWGWCACSKCGEWSIEFRADYSQDPKVLQARAAEAWNLAPRAFAATTLEKAGAMRSTAAPPAPVAQAKEQQLSTPAPAVVVADRQPTIEAGDLDDQGRCWWGDAGNEQFVPSWRLCERLEDSHFTHWLPHWAIPLPNHITNRGDSDV